MRWGARVLKYVDNDGRLVEVHGCDPVTDYDVATAGDLPEVVEINVEAKRSQVRRLLSIYDFQRSPFKAGDLVDTHAFKTTRFPI